MFDILKNNKNFRYLYFGGVISTIGDYLYDIAITLLVFDITKSINSIAFMWLSKGLLRIFVQYFSGQISDRLNRKYIIVSVNLISIIPALLLIFINKHTIVLAYLGVFLLQSLNDIDTCGETSILPEIVKKQELSQANSLFSATSTIVMFCTLGISGIVYTKLGANILFLLNALSFLVCSILFSRIKYSFTKKESKQLSIKSLFDIKGLYIINENKILKTVIIISSLLAISSRIYDIYNISIATDILQIGSEGIIYFRYSIAIGALLAPIIINKCLAKDGLNTYIYICILNCIIFLSLPLISNFYISLIFFIFFGLTTSLQAILLTTILQKNTDNEFIGRVFSFYKILITLISLITVSIIAVIGTSIDLRYIFGVIGCILMIFCIAIKLTNLKKV